MSDYISRGAAIEKIREAAGCAECDGNSSALCCCNVCDVYNAIRLIKNLPAADVEPVQRWILCKDRPPKECGRYQAVVESEAFPGSRYIDTLSYDKFGWRDGCCYVSGVSHWMPLPGMPEGEGDECKNRKSRGTSA